MQVPASCTCTPGAVRLGSKLAGAAGGCSEGAGEGAGGGTGTSGLGKAVSVVPGCTALGAGACSGSALACGRAGAAAGAAGAAGRSCRESCTAAIYAYTGAQQLPRVLQQGKMQKEQNQRTMIALHHQPPQPLCDSCHPSEALGFGQQLDAPFRLTRPEASSCPPSCRHVALSQTC